MPVVFQFPERSFRRLCWQGLESIVILDIEIETIFLPVVGKEGPEIKQLLAYQVIGVVVEIFALETRIVAIGE